MQEEKQITKIEIMVLYVLWAVSALTLLAVGYLACLKR
jgi:hypothetical protein